MLFDAIRERMPISSLLAQVACAALLLTAFLLVPPSLSSSRRVGSLTHATRRGHHAGAGPVAVDMAPASRKQLQEKPLQSQQRPRGPRIFIYDLPEVPFRVCEGYELYRATSTYAAELFLPEAIRASPYHTEDPEQADFFYVWAWLYCARGEIAGPGVHPHVWMQTAVRNTLALLRERWPFWDRKNGRDHLWLFSHDNGYCGFEQGEPMAPEIAGSVVLSHWGHTRREIPCPLEARLGNFDRCEGRSDPQVLADHLPCFVHGKDAVVAHSGRDVPPDYPRLLQPRNTTLFFAGDARLPEGLLSYSHGARQELVQLFGNRQAPGIKVVDTHLLPEQRYPDYETDMQSAVFCLALTGAGWGVRLKQALGHGCIPVVVADGVEMQWEDVLPYPEFAVRLPQHALYRLPEALALLQGIPGRVASMQSKLPCINTFMSWQAPWGQALEALACSLRRKMEGGRAIEPRIDWDTCTLLCH